MSSFLLRSSRKGDEDWQEHDLADGETVVGRDEECGIQIIDDEISRQHLSIQTDGDDIWIRDLQSKNGTKLENREIRAGKKVRIRVGQEIQIGTTILLIHIREHYAAVEEDGGPEIGSAVSAVHSEMQFSDFVLNYKEEDNEWQEFALPLGETVIGRYIESDLCLSDDMISRRHTRIFATDEEVHIQDLGSTNGTQVNDQPLSPRQPFALGEDDLVTIGGYVVRIEKKKYVKPEPKTMVADIRELLPSKKRLAQKGIETEIKPLDFGQMDNVSIGRMNDNDIVLDHPMVSRYHAIIEKMGARFRLRDLNSTNGVFVNRIRIHEDAWLTDGDRITVGPSQFLLAGSNLQHQTEFGLHVEALHVNQFVSKNLNLLRDIGLHIRPMEFVAIVGMSGAGKTTLLNAISGYFPASDGQVLINGVDLYEHYEYFRNEIGYVPQDDIVHAELTPATALDYVARLRLPRDTTKVERKALVDEVLINLDLEERRDVHISNLSGGQLKRASIGVELLSKPRLLFLDEATSGLDPGTEYEMMKLFRRLADQGRTIMLVTHATKNVMLCDKVIFLVRGGHIAYFGPPEQGLEYFDQYRTTREQREKPMEFDDIYRVLNDDKRGEPAEWDQRYKQSDVHQAMSRIKPVDEGPTPEQEAAERGKKGKRKISSFRQFLILSSRNLRILLQDKVSLALMLALAPTIGMDFIWGPNLFDPVHGDAAKIITMWFMASLTTVLVGAMSSVREIVKELDIYKRERAVNLNIAPYIFSKIWIGVVLALYQAGTLLLMKLLFVKPAMPSMWSYPALYLTLFLGTLCGYFIGLAISTISPNQNAALLLIIGALVPQFLFAGALLPLDLIPGGEAISTFMPTRWGFESFVKISGMGDKLANDPLWELEKNQRIKLSDEEKEASPCMGESIFTACGDFPGILSPDYYDDTAVEALDTSKPTEPMMPSPYPSLTPLPTPTLLPSPTSYPPPENPLEMFDYMHSLQEQGDDYQDQVLAQMEAYRIDREAQGEIYSDLRTSQGEEYQEAMRNYGDERTTWQENRERAISNAEGVLENIYDNFGRAFKGSIYTRWLILVALMFFFSGVVLVFQKRKDLV